MFVLKSKTNRGDSALKVLEVAPVVLALAVSMGTAQLQADEEEGSRFGSFWPGFGWPQQQDEAVTDEQENAQKNPLIFNARLFSGTNDIALEFTIDPWAQAPEASAQIAEISSGLRYRYDTIPETETLPFVSHVNLVSKADTVNVARGTASYNSRGQLEEFTLPSDLHADYSAHLVGSVSKAMDVLSSLKPGVLSLLEDGSTALVVSGASGIVFTIYGSEEPIEPQVEVVIPAKGEAAVKVLAEGLGVRLSAKAHKFSKVSPKNLKVVGLMVTHKGAIPGAVIGYFKDLVNSIEYRDLRSGFLKLGMTGEASWNSLAEYERRIKEKVYGYKWVNAAPDHAGNLSGSGVRACVYRYDDIYGRFDVLLTDIETAEEALRKIYHVYSAIEMGEGRSFGLVTANSDQVRFVVRPELVGEMRRQARSGGFDYVIESINDVHASTSYASPMSARKALDKVVASEGNRNARTRTYGKWVRGDSVKEYLRANTRAFAAGAVVGGSIGAGVRVYDRYRRDGKLPYRYTKAELIELGKHSANDGFRGGINGAATMNVMKFTGAPAPVAGAVVAAANSLYSSYQSGELSWSTAAPVTARAAAESMVAATGGWAGESVFQMLPYGKSVPVKVGGALAGSLVGHYAYQLAVDRYGTYLPEAIRGKPKNTVLKLR